MIRSRFEFALNNLRPALWVTFEELASTFLAAEYPQLRTLAGTGDRGRDAVLWQPATEPSIVLQYSVTRGWSQKIKTTAKTIHDNFPDTQVLIYVTNHQIGPKADSVRSELRTTYRLFLDIRDASWFLDRQNQSRSTAAAAEAFSAPIVDSLLAKSSLIEQTADALSVSDARAAVLFLAMQWEDGSRDKGLTKLSFEALVTAALRDTDSDRRMSREAVCKSVRSAIHYHDPVVVDKNTNSALGRLAKRRIRHWKQEDEFCLSFTERQRRTDALVKLELLDLRLDVELLELLKHSSRALGEDIESEQLRAVVPYVRRVLESFLLKRGEAFAQSLSDGNIVLFTVDEIRSLCITQITSSSPTGLSPADAIPLVSTTVENVLVRPSPNAQRYLRALADGYTLFAFLQQVPDTQRVVRKVFSYGRVWLDTSAVLPLLGEMLLEEEERSYTRTLGSARRAGMKLYVTPGVIKELYHHIQHALRCQQYGASWRSRVPFLYSVYLWSGRPSTDFRRWTAEFMGTHQPLDDIADFLYDVAKVKERSLASKVAEADDNFRWSIVRYWQDVHWGRSQAADGSRDAEVAKQLAEHDVENFLGVIMARRSEKRVSSLGHEYWWLTLDRRAYRATSEICEQGDCEPFDSPVMSYDFLINYVALGPRRADVTKDEERLLPLMLDMSLLDGIPKDILDIAEATRDEMAGLSERLVRREIRDRLNAARLRSGPIAHAGLDAIELDLREALTSASESAAR